MQEQTCLCCTVQGVDQCLYTFPTLKSQWDGEAYASFLAGSTDENVLPAHAPTADKVKKFRNHMNQPSVSQMSQLERHIKGNKVMHEYFPNPSSHPIGYGKTMVHKHHLRAAASCDSNPVMQQELRRQLDEMEEQMARQRQAEASAMAELLQSQVTEAVATAREEVEAEAAKVREEATRVREEATRIREEAAKMVEKQVAAKERSGSKICGASWAACRDGTTRISWSWEHVSATSHWFFQWHSC